MSTVGTTVSAAPLAQEHSVRSTGYLIGNMLARVNQTSALLSSAAAIPTGFTGRHKTSHNGPLGNNLYIANHLPNSFWLMMSSLL